jgi:SNF2 family DNA or RNA helicase
MSTRTYGAVHRGKEYWQIECEPQVRMRFKRVFTKVRQRDSDLMLLDTPENGRELAWFLERYPMVIAPADRRYLDDRAEQHRSFANDIGRIVSDDYLPRDYTMALPARDYQKVGADLALHTGGLLLGDDVGLGKTITAIAALSDPRCRPALVVTLTHLPKQWKAELERFLPGIKVHILKKGTPYPLEKKGRRGQRDLFEGGRPDILVSNYHKLPGWAEELAGKVEAIIFDECQELRHTDSMKYQAAERIAAGAKVRMGLSATPVFNMGGEVFNILRILRPGALGSKTEFSIEWLDTYGSRVKDPRALGSYLREAGLMLRRTRAEVGRELPALTIVPHLIEVDFEEINKMAGSAAELARLILQQGGAGIDKMKEAAEFNWRLRQATGITKAPFVADLVRMLAEGGEKVLLAGWHHEVYGIWREKLKDLKPVFFTGDESPTEKQKSKDAFTKGDSQVLVMSLRAGAGIDGLQGVCSTVVIGEPDWSPAVHEQFIGRVFRDGQPNPVFAYFPLADSGSDPVIADILGIKRAQLEGIRDPKADLIDRTQSDPDRIKKLARAYLEQCGESVPSPAAESDAA